MFQFFTWKHQLSPWLQSHYQAQVFSGLVTCLIIYKEHVFWLGSVDSAIISWELKLQHTRDNVALMTQATLSFMNPASPVSQHPHVSILPFLRQFKCHFLDNNILLLRQFNLFLLVQKTSIFFLIWLFNCTCFFSFVGLTSLYVLWM